MGETTGIAWTDATWNPWHGCTHVSAGCDNCYMFAQKRSYGQDPEKVVRSKTKFQEPLKWAEPRMVFTCSWSDFFHVDADPWRAEAWDIIRRTPQHTYQVLTKRHGRIRRCLPADWGDGYPNVWLGVSAENQEWYDRRVSVLLDVPAVVRFVSAEPLLGPIDANLTRAPRDEDYRGWDLSGPIETVITRTGQLLRWIIIGGESGPNRRPCKVEWITSIVDQCHDANVACFVKQDSALRPDTQGRIPDSYWVRQFPAARTVT